MVQPVRLHFRPSRERGGDGQEFSENGDFDQKVLRFRSFMKENP